MARHTVLVVCLCLMLPPSFSLWPASSASACQGSPKPAGGCIGGKVLQRLIGIRLAKVFQEDGKILALRGGTWRGVLPDDPDMHNEDPGHVATWKQKYRYPPGCEHLELPTFEVLNPDPNEPWPPPECPGAKRKKGPGEFVTFADPEWDGKSNEAASHKQDRDRRAERRARVRQEHMEHGGRSFEYFDPASVEGYMNKEDWMRDHLKDPEDVELVNRFLTFMQQVYPSRRPETAQLSDIELFFNASKRMSKRKDNFPWLQRDKAEALEAEYAELSKSIPEQPSLLDESPIPRLITWWQGIAASYGVLFDVQARDQDVVVRKIHCASYSADGPFNYAIWTTEGSWRYKSHSERLWTKIAQACVDLAFERGNYTEIPLHTPVHIKAGCTQSFYVHSPDNALAVSFRLDPLPAIDDGEHCAPDDWKVDEAAETVSVDGVKYLENDTPARSGDVVDRNKDLLVMTGASSLSTVPFTDVVEDKDRPMAWCGMLDYTLGPPSGVDGGDHGSEGHEISDSL